MKIPSIVSVYLQPAFLICVLVLAAGAAGMPILISSLGGFIEKEPLPLKQSLENLDANGFGPYEVVLKSKIEEDIIQTLGTENYIQWMLVDKDALPDSPVRKCMLFITYYELPDIVPHVPQECYVGGGNELVSEENVQIEVIKGDFKRSLSAACLIFSTKEGGLLTGTNKFPVLYFFHSDGEYSSSREETRYILNKNLFRRNSYFSKVEWKFFNNNEFGTQIYPTRQEAVEASKKLLALILPMLEEEYWPEWEK